MDGIFGLGFSSISKTGSDNFVLNAFSQGQVSKAEFSFALNEATSELYIGGDNPSKYTGEFTCTPVTKEGYWQVDGAARPSTSKSITEQYSGEMIIDSGTTILMGDETNVKKFYDGIPGASPCITQECGETSGYYTVPCERVPDVVVTFSGRSFTIPSTSFNCESLPEPASSGSVLIAVECSGAGCIW
jgi:cathepsin D